jgi:hypothetical protein
VARKACQEKQARTGRVTHAGTQVESGRHSRGDHGDTGRQGRTRKESKAKHRGVRRQAERVM